MCCWPLLVAWWVVHGRMPQLHMLKSKLRKPVHRRLRFPGGPCTWTPPTVCEHFPLRRLLH